MADLSTSLTKGQDLFEGTTEFYPYNDAADSKIGGVYSHNSIQHSANAQQQYKDWASYINSLLFSGNINKFAELYQAENNTDTAIGTASQWHAVENFTAGDTSGFTVDAGSHGTITAYADGGSGEVTVTSASHDLAAGDYVTIDGTTNYDGIYEVESIDGDDFTVIATWVADDASGVWARGDSVIVDTGGAGTVEVSVSVSVDCATGGRSILLGVVKNDSVVDGSVVAHYAVTEPTTVSLRCLVAVTAADRLCLAVQNIDDTEDLTISYANLVARRVSL